MRVLVGGRWRKEVPLLELGLVRPEVEDAEVEEGRRVCHG